MKSNKTILLADDDIDDIKLFCEALQEVDTSVVCHTVTDGSAVLELLVNTPSKPDVIFLDINMPRMNGWQCLAELKQEKAFSNIPVFIYSTSTNPKDAEKALDLGALCFFAKPNEFEELKKVLRVIVDNLGGDVLHAISHFNSIKSMKVFSCEEK